MKKNKWILIIIIIIVIILSLKGWSFVSYLCE